MGELVMDEDSYEYWRGKFRRFCEPKRGTGKIEAPTDIWKQYQEKGSSREKFFELYIKTGGEKDWVVVGRVER